MPPTSSPTHGFSLVQVSVMLAVAGVILAASLPGGEKASDSNKDAITLERMKAIENATQQFMATNLRRPCPANGSDALDGANFGIEETSPGNCTGLDFSTGSIVGGVVPVRTLGLPDEYALDGYNRRFTYIVDENATSVTTCRNYQSQGTKGGIDVLTGTTSGTVTDNVMWALISHGKDGHGAYPANGSTAAGRYRSFNNESKTLINAALDSSFLTVFTGDIVKAAAEDNFDDKVWYHEPTKNTCCVGVRCSQGFRVDTNASATELVAGVTFAVGDVNNDGLDDLVYANHNSASDEIKIILGSQTDLPVSPTSLDGATAADYRITNDNGENYTGATIAIGDATGDGVNDILFNAEANAYLIFDLATAGTGSHNISDLMTDGYATQIGTIGAGVPGPVAFGDVDGDGYQDLIFTGLNVSNYLAIMYGKDAGSWPASTNMVAGYQYTFYFYSATARKWCGSHYGLVTADINKDGYDDIICGGITDSLQTSGTVTFIEGRARASFPTTNPARIEINAEVTAGTNAAYFYSSLASEVSLGQSVDIADINNDGYPDMLMVSDRSIYAIAGQSGNYNGSGNDINGGGTTMFRVDTLTNRPAAADLTGTNKVLTMADINGDAFEDIVFTAQGADLSNSDGGMTYVLFQPTQALGWGSDGFAANTPISFFSASASGYANFDGTKGFLIEGEASEYITHNRVSDFNKDGKPDIIISGLGAAGNAGGSIYVIYGRDNIPWRSRYDSTVTTLPKIDITDINN